MRTRIIIDANTFTYDGYPETEMVKMALAFFVFGERIEILGLTYSEGE